MTATVPAPAVVLPDGAPVAAARPDPFIVAPRSIRELLHGRTFTWEAPRDLGTCVVGIATSCERVAVATVTWPSQERTAEVEARACRTCLPLIVDSAASVTEHHDGRVDVAVPGWRPADLPSAIPAMTPRQLAVWISNGYLHCEDEAQPGSGYERGLLCADEVVAAAAIAALVALDVSPRGARRLWNADRALAAEVIETGRAGTGLRPPVGPDGEVYTDGPEPSRHRDPDPSCRDCGGQGHPSPGRLCGCQQ